MIVKLLGRYCRVEVVMLCFVAKAGSGQRASRTSGSWPIKLVDSADTSVRRQQSSPAAAQATIIVHNPVLAAAVATRLLLTAVRS